MDNKKLTRSALLSALDVIGGYIVLITKIPLFWNAYGTMISSALYGPLYGIATGTITYTILFFMGDTYSFYFLPSHWITAIMISFIYNRGWLQDYKRFLSMALVALPSSLYAGFVEAQLFGGVSVDPSSALILLIHNVFNIELVVAVFIFQFIREYADRVITAFIVTPVIKYLETE